MMDPQKNALEKYISRKNVKHQTIWEKRIYSPLTPDQPPPKGGRFVIRGDILSPHVAVCLDSMNRAVLQTSRMS